MTFQVGLTAFAEISATLWYMRIPARPLGFDCARATTAAANLRNIRLFALLPATRSQDLFSADRYCSKLLRLNAFFASTSSFPTLRRSSFMALSSDGAPPHLPPDHIPTAKAASRRGSLVSSPIPPRAEAAEADRVASQAAIMMLYPAVKQVLRLRSIINGAVGFTRSNQIGLTPNSTATKNRSELQ